MAWPLKSWVHTPGNDLNQKKKGGPPFLQKSGFFLQTSISHREPWKPGRQAHPTGLEDSVDVDTFRRQTPEFRQ